MSITLNLVWFIVIYALLPALGLMCVAIIVAGWLRDLWRWLFVVAIVLMVCGTARAAGSPTPSSTPTPFAVSVAVATTTIEQAGVPGVPCTLTDAEMQLVNAGSITWECCTTGSGCATNCAVCGKASSLVPKHHDSGSCVCASALMDVCMILTGGGAAGTVLGTCAQ